ncbi:MAG: phosphate ABC transporter permease subunit PstC [Chloroflexi bacterium]|nr:MAG: phosphate ABC transporter permease subunit PstC [Chloroflexota bacterium]
MATAQATDVRAGAPPRPADGFKGITTVISLAAPVVLILIVLVVILTALPAIRTFGAGFVTSRVWDPPKEQFGALPFIYGTVITSVLALILALPVGIGVALFLAEQGLGTIRGAIGIGVELLAAIPSVVYGIWGLYILAPWLLHHISQPLAERLGAFPPFAAPASQLNMLIASVILAVMILPTLSSISREVIRAVPGGLREASVAMGATWWETVWKVILPAARSGIFGATILSFGRALGETMAVTMTIGNKNDIPTSLFYPAYTLASKIANEFNEATGTLYPAALIELGLMLMIVTLIVNLLALILVHRVSREARA